MYARISMPLTPPALAKHPPVYVDAALAISIDKSNLKLLLQHLRTGVVRRVAHHFRFVDGRLTAAVRIGAGSTSLSAAFDEDMSLFSVSFDLCTVWEEEMRTFNASLREKLFSQCPQGNGFTAR
jgi:hypothetical protein